MACTSTRRCGTPCAPSITTVAPTRLAICVISWMGITVPRALEMWVKETTRVLGPSSFAYSARRMSPLSSTGATRMTAPLFWIHALDWIKHGVGEEELRKRVKKSLAGLRVANYYGCMYTRPRHIFPEKDQGPGSEST